MIAAQDIRGGLAVVHRRLRGQPGVLSVGMGEHPENGRYCIVVCLNAAAGAETDKLPEHVAIAGARVPVRTSLLSSEALVLANDVLDGSDLLLASGVGRFGTLGLVMRDAGTNTLFGITNAHVVTRPDENHVGDRVRAVIGGSEHEIGRVAYHAAYRTAGVNAPDLALIELNATGAAHAAEFRVQTFPGLVVGSGTLSFSRFAGARRPHGYGASTHSARHIVACSDPVEHPLIDLRDSSGHLLRFGRAFTLTASDGGVRPGHSGALIVREKANQDLIAVGLLAGGAGGTAVAFSMADVLREISKTGVVLA
ncbi:hypothetical protein [uncultured Roseobacter sp.]|uniref:hypothetical protein n=1 Tax=uncultured Roseobacter sp. TaxID=114847 RepID=UPI0026215A5C|nr:hypothetical protein [uncultured Roseobacter sp.]